jgi:hypothetical protein
MKNKKAAIEMSMSTIIILVLGVSMLILGMILIRSIMCAGLQITEDVSTGVKNEVKTLFGADKVGVKCMGEGAQEINIATGGQRKIICIIKTEEQANYELTATKVESLSGAPTSAVEGWVLSKTWQGTVKPGSDTDADVLLLNIPRDAPKTTLRITTQVKNVKSGAEETITSTIGVVPTGVIKGAIC